MYYLMIDDTMGLKAESYPRRQEQSLAWLVRAVLLALLVTWPGVQFVASAAEISTAPAIVAEAATEVERRDDSVEYYRARLTLDAALAEAETSGADAGDAGQNE